MSKSTKYISNESEESSSSSESEIESSSEDESESSSSSESEIESSDSEVESNSDFDSESLSSESETSASRPEIHLRDYESDDKASAMDKYSRAIRKRLRVRDRTFLDVCYDGDVKRVNRYIENGETDFVNGLRQACEGGRPRRGRDHLEIVDMMIELGKESITKDDWDYCLAMSCASGNIDIVKRMIEHGANDWNDGLSNACYEGHYSVAKLMIKHGADNYNEALDSACSYEKDNRAIINMLIELGANDWNQGLSSATGMGHTSHVLLMLELGANNFDEALKHERKINNRKDVIKAIEQKASKRLNPIDVMLFGKQAAKDMRDYRNKRNSK